MDLQTPIQEAGRLFKTYASRLEKLGITKLEDILTHFPFRYDNYSVKSTIEQVQIGETVTIQGEITESKNQYIRSGKTLQKATLQDESGSIDLTWFNQPFIPKTLPVGAKASVSGRIEEFNRKKVMQNPDYELISESGETIHTGRLVPVYPETRGVSSKWLRRQAYKLLKDHVAFVEEYLPPETQDRHTLLGIQKALKTIHFPDSYDEIEAAKARLAFDEVFLMQTAALVRRKQWKQKEKGFMFSTNFPKEIDTFLKSLPFELTNSQKKAIDDIFADVSSDNPMNRLLEGDVGSGKTVVGAMIMYVAFLNGYQSVLMAPTEILAGQHFNTVKNILSPLGLTVELATGSKKIKDTEFDVLIGTHAVLSEKITFKKLGVVIIDEQQRFGVRQRAVIRQKGKNPHLLTMTATPIPRTVALTRYGDLDLSYLSDMPKGRMRIKTWLVPPEKRDPAYEWMEKEIKTTDSQAFIICPFIEESENMQTVKAATKEFERLQKDVFPHLKLGLLHGKLKGKEKDIILEEFKNRKYDILVATPVVEVGIDIPNATIIVIEAADRFGLSQLHQLRGRVGRGSKQSYCLLFTESTNDQTKERLKAMETIHNGAELAELDLKLRGAGELYGTMQHGIREFKLARFSDFDLIEKARREAQIIVEKIEQYPKLLTKIKDSISQEISPD